MSLLLMVEKEMCHKEPDVETLYLVSIIYTCCCNVLIKCISWCEWASQCLIVSKSLFHPLFIARLAIFLIMQALCLYFLLSCVPYPDILSYFIITQTSYQPERPWLSSVNQICCLGLNSTTDALASCLASCLELLVYEANTPLSTQTVDGCLL